MKMIGRNLSGIVLMYCLLLFSGVCDAQTYVWYRNGVQVGTLETYKEETDLKAGQYTYYRKATLNSKSLFSEPFTVTVGHKIKDCSLGGYTAISVDGWNVCWMTQNLSRPSGTLGTDYWANDEYGYLYTWDAAQTACPAGWRLPGDWDWLIWYDYFGGTTAGTAMKSTMGWNSNGNGNNSAGFNGRPGGYRAPDGNFYYRGQVGNWWCTAHDGGSRGVSWRLGYGYSALWRYLELKSYGFSVRCVRNL